MIASEFNRGDHFLMLSGVRRARETDRFCPTHRS